MELHTRTHDHNPIAQLERWWLSASMMVMLGSCALQVPEAVAEEPTDNPEFAAVVIQPNNYLGDQVHWGGTITAVENRGPHEAVLIIANKALDSQGKPLADASSGGQFMAKIDHFLNPAIYAKGKSVTVAGTIVGLESRTIYNDPDSYPFVAVNDYYVWPELQSTTGYHYSCEAGMSPYPDTLFGYGQSFYSCR